MSKPNGIDDENKIDIAYVEQMCYEFSKLLYDISEEYNSRCVDLQIRCSILEKKCSEYETQILQGDNRRIGFLIKLKNWLKGINKKIKHLFFLSARISFGFGRWLSACLGIKEKVKNTKLFQKMYIKGTIDKLRR